MNARILAASWLAPRTTCRGLHWTSQCAQVLALLIQTVADAGSALLQKIQLAGWLLAVLLIALPAGEDDPAPDLLKVCIAYLAVSPVLTPAMGRRSSSCGRR